VEAFRNSCGIDEITFAQETRYVSIDGFQSDLPVVYALLLSHFALLPAYMENKNRQLKQSLSLQKRHTFSYVSWGDGYGGSVVDSVPCHRQKVTGSNRTPAAT